jgi:tetratricopeptide (TPR) repeat protein
MIGGRLARGLTLAALVLGGAGPVRADFDQAMAYFKAGKFLEAAAGFQTLVDGTPSYDYGHYMLGNCLLRMGRPADAEHSFRRAIEIRGDKSEYRHGLAVALKDQRRYVKALGALSQEQPLVHDRGTAYSFFALRGYLLAQLRRWGDAAGDLEQALSIKGDPTLFDLLGRAYFTLGRYDRSAAAFLTASNGAPSDPRPCRMLAESLLELAAAVPDPARKRMLYTQAMSAALRLVRLEPGDPDCVAILGRAALGAGQYQAAEAAFKAVLAVRPGTCHVLVNLSRALVALDRTGEAESALRDASRCAPTMAEVSDGLGRVYYRQRRFAEAMDAFRRADAIQPSAATRAGIEAVRVKLQDGANR